MQNLIATLSERQRQVYDLVCQGYSNQEVAKELMISLATVKYHMTGVLNNLGVSSRAEAIVYGQGSRDIELPQVGGGVAWTEEQIRLASLKLVELGLVDKKVINEIVVDLLGVLAGKIK